MAGVDEPPAMPANSSSGTNEDGQQQLHAPGFARRQFTPAQSHRPPSASAAAHSKSPWPRNNALTLPAKVTAIAALPHQIETQ